MTLSAIADAVGTTAAHPLRWIRQQRACGARAAYSSCGTSPAAFGSKAMLPEAHTVVWPTVDGLRAACYIRWHHPVAKGWSADLSTRSTCTAEELIRPMRHRQQTARRSWSVGRDGRFAALGTSHLIWAAALEPLSSCTRPLEVWRPRGWKRQRHRCLRQSSFRN